MKQKKLRVIYSLFFVLPFFSHHVSIPCVDCSLFCKDRINHIPFLLPQAYLPWVWESLQNSEAAIESPEKAQREPSQNPGTQQPDPGPHADEWDQIRWRNAVLNFKCQSGFYHFSTLQATAWREDRTKKVWDLGQIRGHRWQTAFRLWPVWAYISPRRKSGQPQKLP